MNGTQGVHAPNIKGFFGGSNHEVGPGHARIQFNAFPVDTEKAFHTFRCVTDRGTSSEILSKQSVRQKRTQSKLSTSKNVFCNKILRSI